MASKWHDRWLLHFPRANLPLWCIGIPKHWNGRMQYDGRNSYDYEWRKTYIMDLYCTAHRMHMNLTLFTPRAPKTRWISRIGPLPLLDQWVWLATELRAQFAIGGLWVGMMLMLMVLLLVAVAVMMIADRRLFQEIHASSMTNGMTQCKLRCVGLWKEAVGISQAERWGLWCFDGSGEVCCACAARSQWHYERRTSPSGTLWGTGHASDASWILYDPFIIFMTPAASSCPVRILYQTPCTNPQAS